MLLPDMLVLMALPQRSFALLFFFNVLAASAQEKSRTFQLPHFATHRFLEVLRKSVIREQDQAQALEEVVWRASRDHGLSSPRAWVELQA